MSYTKSELRVMYSMGAMTGLLAVHGSRGQDQAEAMIKELEKRYGEIPEEREWDPREQVISEEPPGPPDKTDSSRVAKIVHMPEANTGKQIESKKEE